MPKLPSLVLVAALSACSSNAPSTTCTADSTPPTDLTLPDAGTPPSCTLAWSCGSETFALACVPTDSTAANLWCYCFQDSGSLGREAVEPNFDCDGTRGLDLFQQVCQITITTTQ